MKKTLLLIVALAPLTAFSDEPIFELSKMVGWSITDTKIIKSTINQEGREFEGFAGCEVGAKIIFTDKTSVPCLAKEGFMNSSPLAVIFQHGKYTKIMIDDSFYLVGPPSTIK